MNTLGECFNREGICVEYNLWLLDPIKFLLGRVCQLIPNLPQHMEFALPALRQKEVNFLQYAE